MKVKAKDTPKEERGDKDKTGAEGRGAFFVLQIGRESGPLFWLLIRRASFAVGKQVVTLPLSSTLWRGTKVSKEEEESGTEPRGTCTCMTYKP